MSKSLLSIVENSVHNWPNNPALWVKGAIYNYQQLWDKAAQLSVAIQNRPNDIPSTHVAIYAHKSLSAYIGILSSVLSGLNYLPLNPRFPSERNAKMIAATEARIWVVDNRCLEEAQALLSELQEPVFVLLPEMERLEDWCHNMAHHHFFSKQELGNIDVKQWIWPNILPSDGAYTLFTSGSTGVPKGVLVTHDNVISYLNNVQDMVPVLPNDRCTQLFDLTFDVSVHDLFTCWSSGACLYVIPENSALFVGRFVQEHELTHWFSVPSTVVLMKQMNLLEANAFPTLKYVCFAGEALQRSLTRTFQEAAPNAEVMNLYGPTEATITFTGYRWTVDDQESTEEGVVPIGPPWPSQHIAIVDEDLKPVPQGALGELYLGGSQVTPGYYKNASLTSERFVTLPCLGNGKDGIIFYRTGDLASWDERCGVKFHGRVDRQVKIRGFRVELQEIENALRGILDTEHVAVIGTPVNAKDGFKGISAYIAASSELSSEAIIEAARKKLPDYMVPDAIHWLRELPLNSNGKIDYKAINALHEIKTASPC